MRPVSHDAGTGTAGMRDPLVTISLAAYNREAYLTAALDSVLAQSYNNWELWIIDDGSTDCTAEIAQRYLRDPRVHYVHQANAGQASAKNHGVRAGSGPLVCFLDSDNLWLPHKLRQQVNIMQADPATGVLYGEIDFIDADGGPMPTARMRRHSGTITHQLLRDNFVTFNTCMIRREFYERIGGMDESLRRAPDYDLWLRMSTHCTFRYEPEVWAKYRVMSDQISSDKTGRFAANELIIRRFMQANPQVATPEAQRDAWCSFHTQRGRYFASVGRRGMALRDYWTAMREQPFSHSPWRALARLVLKGR